MVGNSYAMDFINKSRKSWHMSRRNTLFCIYLIARLLMKSYLKRKFRDMYTFLSSDKSFPNNTPEKIEHNRFFFNHVPTIVVNS